MANKKLFIIEEIDPITKKKTMLESRLISISETVQCSIVETFPEMTYETGKNKYYSFNDNGEIIINTEDAPVNPVDELRAKIETQDLVMQDLLMNVIPSLTPERNDG